MIVPSIDLLDGQAVQLISGRELAIEAGDPVAIARRFSLAGEIAVVDLDGALRQGDNRGLIKDLLSVAQCRVGGGIRDTAAAVDWLDAGAASVVLGTAAVPEVLRRLPKNRVVAAVDAIGGEVVVDGWRQRTGKEVTATMGALREYVSGFLVTFVEREGRMSGIDLDEVSRLKDAAGDARLTVAGGITSPDEIAALDDMGVDAQVGMALYTDRLTLADAVAAPLKSDRADGLWPTVVVDERGVCLGLAWSSAETLRLAFDEQRGIYHSRRRGVWRKGDTSGAKQDLLRVDVDCDRDTLRFTVHQHDVFCHKGSRTCFGPDRGLGALQSTIADRRSAPPTGTYTQQLLASPELLGAKLIEEAGELGEAADTAAVIHEAADVLYFTLVKLADAGVSLVDVERELDRRSMRTGRGRGAQ